MTDKERLIKLLESFDMEEGNTGFGEDFHVDNERNEVLIFLDNVSGMAFAFDYNDKFITNKGFSCT